MLEDAFRTGLASKVIDGLDAGDDVLVEILMSDRPNLAIGPRLADGLAEALRATSMSTVGPQAMDAMRRMTADKVFLSADGVVAGRGLCEASFDQVALKSLMMEQAREVIVLADVTKLSRSDQAFGAQLPHRWTLITDTQATAAQCESFTTAGAHVIRAEV